MNGDIWEKQQDTELLWICQYFEYKIAFFHYKTDVTAKCLARVCDHENYYAKISSFRSNIKEGRELTGGERTLR